MSAAGNALNLNSATGAIVTATTNTSVSGPFDITLNFQNGGIGGLFAVELGGDGLFSYGADNNAHSLRIVADGAGNASSYLDGSSTAYSTATGIATSGSIVLDHVGGVGASTSVQNLSVTGGASATGDVSSVATAGSLDSLSLASITGAIADVATYRAQNGASQSRLGFAAELIIVNKANLEAATSRITDVDVATESTSLARYNILVQAGTAMLGQANQSSQNALKLLG